MLVQPNYEHDANILDYWFRPNSFPKQHYFIELAKRKMFNSGPEPKQAEHLFFFSLDHWSKYWPYIVGPTLVVAILARLFVLMVWTKFYTPILITIVYSFFFFNKRKGYMLWSWLLSSENRKQLISRNQCQKHVVINM